MAKKKLTKHAKKRIKGRVGVRNAKYNYSLARKYGKTYQTFNGTNFGTYLTYIATHSKCRANVIVYNEHIYIIKNGKLITVLNVPNKYKEQLENDKQRVHQEVWEI